MATQSSVLAWRIPGTGKPGGLPSMGSHGVSHDWSDLAAAAGKREDFLGAASGKEPACQFRKQKRRVFHPWVRKSLWSRKWQPSLVFFPGESHRQRSLVGYSQEGRRVWLNWGDLTPLHAKGRGKNQSHSSSPRTVLGRAIGTGYWKQRQTAPKRGGEELVKYLRGFGVSKNSICYRVWGFSFLLENLGSSPCFAPYQNQMPHYNESLLKIKMLDVGISWWLSG